MAIKWYSALFKAPELLELHHETVQCHIQTIVGWGVLTFSRDTVGVFYNHSRLGQIGLGVLILEWLYIHRHTDIYIYIYIYVRMRMSVNLPLCVCVCVCVTPGIWIYIHIYIYISIKLIVYLLLGILWHLNLSRLLNAKSVLYK